MLISGCEDERMFPYFLDSLSKYLTAIRRVGFLSKEVNLKFVKSSDPITPRPSSRNESCLKKTFSSFTHHGAPYTILFQRSCCKITKLSIFNQNPFQNIAQVLKGFFFKESKNLYYAKLLKLFIHIKPIQNICKFIKKCLIFT